MKIVGEGGRQAIRVGEPLEPPVSVIRREIGGVVQRIDHRRKVSRAIGHRRRVRARVLRRQHLAGAVIGISPSAADIWRDRGVGDCACMHIATGIVGDVRRAGRLGNGRWQMHEDRVVRDCRRACDAGARRFRDTGRLTVAVVDVSGRITIPICLAAAYSYGCLGSGLSAGRSRRS